MMDSAENSPILHQSSEGGYIFEIQKMSTEDGPGIRTTVFFKQCPLQCAWCHNPESIERAPAVQWFEAKCIGCEQCILHCPTHSLAFDDRGLVINRETCRHCLTCVSVCPTTALKASGEWVSVSQVVQEISKDREYYQQSGGGVTFSGGEPTLQIDFLEALLKECKVLGIHTAVDTCGVAPRKKYERILPYVDLFLYDLKEIDGLLHKKFTGLDNAQILENCIWLADQIKASPGQAMWIRTPIIPQFTGRDANIRGIGEFIVKKLDNAIERWDLLAFNNLAAAKYERLDLEWPLKGIRLYSKEEMDHFLAIAQDTNAKNVHWDGMTRKGL